MIAMHIGVREEVLVLGREAFACDDFSVAFYAVCPIEEVLRP